MPPEINLEKIPTQEFENLPEKKEQSQEKKVEKPVEKKDESDKKIKLPIIKKVSQDEEVSEEKKHRSKEIDGILANGLSDVFLSLSPEKQDEFKKKGEETTVKINNLLDKTKVNLGKIVILIKKWLSIIPGVNRLFLEQEAKIKADRIIKLKKT
jgi:hypothetical protein